jgi:hypothetical protein
MRVLLTAAFLIQAIAFAPAHADNGSRQAAFNGGNAIDLEKAFWVCDYAGTNGVVGPDQAAACIAITDELKRAKFEGDFDRLVEWWRLNKVTQHQALDRIRTATP